MTITEKIGQRLVGGFPGTEMSEEFIRLVKEYKIGNVILFQHNVESSEQLIRLCRSVRELITRETGHRPFITVDQEGGGVTRLPQEAVNVPGAMALAATGDEENARRAAYLTARELRAFGIDFDLAPSVDVNCDPDNPIIGVRSFGDTPEQVSRYALAALRGYTEGGVLCSAKHFPGHGDTAMDTHVSLPCIDKSMEELERMELPPFQAMIDAGCPAVTTTHILFPQLEPEELPATMSRRIITGLLKERMGFRGLVVSDCMEMDAIARHYGSAKGTVKAMAAAAALRRASITLVRGIVPALGERPFFCGCADYRAGLVSNREGGVPAFADFMAARLGGRGLVTSKDPGPEEIRAAVEAARGSTSIFANTYNGHLFPGQLELVRALSGLGVPMAAMALRDPYDLRSVPEGAAAIAAWDYALPTLEVLVPVLSGKEVPAGRLPVALGGRS